MWDRGIRRQLDEHVRDPRSCLDLRRQQRWRSPFFGRLSCWAERSHQQYWPGCRNAACTERRWLLPWRAFHCYWSAHRPLTILAGSAFTGLALAPLFPLILALFLEEIGGSRNAGWVFAVAGLGGAVLSWLTGWISTGTGSLRSGLLVPGAAALLMLMLSSRRRPYRERGHGATQEAQLQSNG